MLAPVEDTMKNATKNSSSSFGLFGKRTMRIEKKKSSDTYNIHTIAGYIEYHKTQS